MADRPIVEDSYDCSSSKPTIIATMMLPVALLLVVPAALADGPLVWPKPVSAITGNSDQPISFSNFSFAFVDKHGPNGHGDGEDNLLRKAAARYAAIIAADGPPVTPQQAQATYLITVTVKDMTVPLSPGPDMNESYVLSVKESGCALSAPTVWGAMRGMETLAQLVKRGSGDKGYELTPVSISDEPRFGWVRRLFPPNPHPSPSPLTLPAACLHLSIAAWANDRYRSQLPDRYNHQDGARRYGIHKA